MPVMNSDRDRLAVRTISALKIVLHLSTLLCSIASTGQPQMERIQFDDNVSFLVPIVHQKIKDGRVNRFSASTEFGYIQVEKISEPQAEIHSKEDLLKVYQRFKNSVAGIAAAD